MARPPEIERAGSPLPIARLRAAAGRATVFFAVEAGAELCRQHLAAPSGNLGGACGGLVAAALAMAWAFAAHRRLAFRGAGRGAVLAGLVRFELVSLACLDLRWGVLRLLAGAAPVLVWASAGALKLALAQRLVWPASGAAPARRPA